MKKNLLSPIMTTGLVSALIFTQGCGGSSNTDELNRKIEALSQKIETLSTKVDSISQQQALTESNRQAELQSQQDAIVHRVADWGYYYNTNLLTKLGDYDYKISLAVETDLKAEVSDVRDKVGDITKQIKPRYGGNFETLGDTINELKQSVDSVKMNCDEIKSDNRKIKEKLGILF